MADTLELQIVTPERAAFSGAVSEVTLPGNVGELGVLPAHRQLLTLLNAGQIVARTTSGERAFAIGSGFAEVMPDRVTVLTSHCDGADDIDVAHARERVAALEKKLDESDFVSDAELAEHVEELARERARLEIVNRATR